MGKKTIRLKKSDLYKLIKENIQDNIQITDINSIDISKINIEILKNAYIDLRLIPKKTSYDDFLSDLPNINEARGDILPPDNVVNEIMRKYHLDPHLIFKTEASNKICIYIITACIGENAKLIKNDMEKMGYFLGCKSEVFQIENMLFQTLQFEPYSQMQNDETINIKNRYNYLYHWTTEYNLNDVLNFGLTPRHQNKAFNYPNRIYLMKGDSNLNEMEKLGQRLCLVNTDPRNDGTYVLLKINIVDIADEIYFYYDSNTDIGVYTEQSIPSTNISVVYKYKFKTLK